MVCPLFLPSTHGRVCAREGNTINRERHEMRGFNNEVLSKLVGCFRFTRVTSEQNISECF